ncbi:MAG: hypothetical protein OXG71_03260 [Rhodospirillales bacterium]|nr:hypothetical protein [Rhodospirillales bacterium]
MRDKRPQRIRDIQVDLEESLASLAGIEIPPELAGLRRLPVIDHNPQVSIRYLDSGRKVRGDAAASYFEPDRCEVVIGFTPIESDHQEAHIGYRTSESGDAEFDDANAYGQLIDRLQSAEELDMEFVGLTWFRDRYLPDCGLPWAQDRRLRGALIRRAIGQRLMLTSRVPNPIDPDRPVTAVRLNRRHPRLRGVETARDHAFEPVAIRGGPLSDTVLADRR